MIYMIVITRRKQWRSLRVKGTTRDGGMEGALVRTALPALFYMYSVCHVYLCMHIVYLHMQHNNFTGGPSTRRDES